MNIMYCEPRSPLLSLGQNQLSTPLSVETARRRHHDRREAYEAVIGEPDHPRFVVCLSPNAARFHSDCASRFKVGNGDRVIVSFIDERLRWYKMYDFREFESDKLFLTLAVCRNFVGATGDVRTATIFEFKADGQIRIQDFLVNNTVEVREVKDSVAGNWDTYPRFGDYGHLCREQRTMTARLYLMHPVQHLLFPV